MKIHIELEYRTSNGLCLRLRTADGLQSMASLGGDRWGIDLKSLPDKREYSFEVYNGDTLVRTEWKGHRLPDSSSEDIRVYDRWNDRPSDSPFHSSLFKDVVFSRGSRRTALKKGNVTLVFDAPQVRPDQTVAITGSGPAFDDWKVMVPLCDEGFPQWKASLNVRHSFEYKFVIVNRATLSPELWEEGPNRLMDSLPEKGVHIVRSVPAPRFAQTPWRGAGTAVPVFALRSHNSFGVGEFEDLKLLVDWAAATGQNIIQLLPINDTTMTHTWEDSYPYNANSTIALHPQFISLPSVGVRQDKAYRALRDELNALPQVDYERVNNEKMRYLRKAYAKASPTLRGNTGFNRFVADNESWLLPYAVFSCLRDSSGTADFSKWGKYAEYSAKKVSEYAAFNHDAVEFWYFVQYHLDRQLKDVVKYAHSKGVGLKGDLPIGISRNSVEAWTEPHYFNLNGQAGAPPDDFSVNGQNWGFPTYNWDIMEQDGYAWWMRRFKKMSEYFDAYRIDHILGFFRIWEIPVQYKSGLMGHFSPAEPYTEDQLAALGIDFRAKGKDENDVLFLEDPRRPHCWHPRISAQYTSVYAALSDDAKARFNNLYDDFFYRRHNLFWKDRAMDKLPTLVDSTPMLTCGEDLGMIPATVPETMEALNILSLEIQRMPKSVNDEFADPARYPYYCVAATGTHDTSTLRAWWEEDKESTAHFYRNMLGCSGEVPFYCEPWVCGRIVDQHLKSPAMLCILPLQDWLSIDGSVRYNGNPSDERINVPAIPRYYWRYRMHLTLEDLLECNEFNANLREEIKRSGRNN